jgi:AraC family transcriptional regulator of adaptative response/methylated-DNA-[protein]-cysteine methyltransferase
MTSQPTKIEIEWGIAESPLGKMLIARSKTGIVHLSFFETNQTDSYRQLTYDWPHASLKRNDRFATKISHQIFQSEPISPLELDLHGTEFQLLVWNALIEIPSGITSTYSQLAKRIGKPSAARAVGNAVGQNRIAYLIPCHRVIREDGSLGGYRWGTTCKSKMLAWEK